MGLYQYLQQVKLIVCTMYFDRDVYYYSDPYLNGTERQYSGQMSQIFKTVKTIEIQLMTFIGFNLMVLAKFHQ